MALALVANGKEQRNVVALPSTTSLLTGELGYRPSWGWRSILHGRDLLLQGLRWQVGDGRSINALNDKWLPLPIPRPPQLLRHLEPRAMFYRVADLIHHGQWDMHILNLLFTDNDVQTILAIPLPIEQTTDKHIWPLSPSGAYKVLSGYELAVGPIIQESYYSPLSDMLPADWTSMWNIPMIPKLKLFIWKILRGALPTRDLIQTRIRDINPQCPVCHGVYESPEHLFMQCPLVHILGSHLAIPLHLVIQNNIILTWKLLINKPRPIRDSFIFFWWRLWKSQNNVVFNRFQEHPRILAAQFQSQITEYQRHEAVSTIPPIRPSIQTPIVQIGRPDNTPYLSRVFVDGATAAPRGGAIGFVVQTPNGDILFRGGGALWQ
ncbi:Putative ribonuclease H protein At1g65750 [Linum grandiflorum]